MKNKSEKVNCKSICRWKQWSISATKCRKYKEYFFRNNAIWSFGEKKTTWRPTTILYNGPFRNSVDSIKHVGCAYVVLETSFVFVLVQGAVINPSWCRCALYNWLQYWWYNCNKSLGILRFRHKVDRKVLSQTKCFAKSLIVINHYNIKVLGYLRSWL